VQAGEEYTGSLANAIGDDHALGQFEIEGGSNELLRDLEKLLREWREPEQSPKVLGQDPAPVGGFVNR
jgi:hypothetical protein